MERIVCVLLCAILLTVDASKILVVVPTPSISHQVVFRPIIKELVKKGHDVTYMTTDPMYPKDKAPKNLTEINLHDQSYKMWRELVFSSGFSGSNQDMTQGVVKMFKLITHIFEQQIQLPEVKLALSKNYDLLIIEAWVKPAFIVMHLCKDVPTILVTTFSGVNGNYEIVGAPVYPVLLYPTVLHQRLSDLSLMEKLTEIYTHSIMDIFYITQDTEYNNFFKKMLGPDAPTVRDLEKNVDMFFINYHPLWDMNRPVPPSVVYIGGIHQNPSKELPQVC